MGATRKLTWLSPGEFQTLAAKHPTAIRGLGILKQFTHDETTDVPDQDRVIRWTITTGNVDRDRDVVLPGGVKTDSYLKNPIVLFGHDYTSLPVAKTLKLQQSGNRWSADAQFATHDLYPFADTVYRMVKAGFLNASSIGFRPMEWTINEERHGMDFMSIELLEWSIVPVPAHPEALVEARSLGIEVEPLKEWAERILDAWGEESGVLVPRTQAEAVYRIANGYAKLVTKPDDPLPGERDEAAVKPYAAEHACRLQDPDKYDRIRSGEREHEGKTYRVLYGHPKGGGGWEEQAYRYPKESWSASEARSHCGGHDGSFEAASEEAAIDITATEIAEGQQDAPPGETKHVPEDSEAVAKRGRVLSAKNETKLKTAWESIGEVLAQVQQQPEPPKEPEEDSVTIVQRSEPEPPHLDIANPAPEEVIDLAEPEPFELPEPPPTQKTELLIDVDVAALKASIEQSIHTGLAESVAVHVQRAINAARGRVD